MSDEKTLRQLTEENQELRIRLQEAEDTIQAIREGAVDAVVVQGPQGEQVFTLSGEEIIYRQLVETMHEAGLTTTPEGTILFCNERFSKMVQLPMEQIVGQPIEQFVQRSCYPKLTALLRNVLSGPCNESLVFYAVDGTHVPTLISANLLRQADSVSICLVAADMTELEAKNQELKSRADQLSRLASELTLTERRERNRLARILHDHLQQLLVGASFGLEAICHQTDDSMRRSIVEVNQLIKESINVSRSLTVELSPTILHEAGLAAGLEWLARLMKEKHGLEVELTIKENAATEREDIRIHLFESVRELLFNVVKHAGVAKAKACLSNRDGRIEIAVSDEGVGFNPEQLLAAKQTNGGFGLFSIRERLELLGGSLKVESSPRKGTRFVLVAPTANRSADNRIETVVPVCPTAPNVHLKTAEAKNKIRVLVADDHAVVRQGLCTLLRCETEIDLIGQASDGKEAVELARQLRPDVILMDFSMPKVDGVAATEMIRSEMPDIKIVGLSMYDEADRSRAMLDAGAEAFVTKTGELENLLKAIRSARKSVLNTRSRKIVGTPNQTGGVTAPRPLS